MSNDKYKSVDHRVIMNTREEARVSIAIFFNPGKRGDTIFYGPLPELVSSDSPPKFRNFTMSEFLRAFFRRDLASRALVDTSNCKYLTTVTSNSNALCSQARPNQQKFKLVSTRLTGDNAREKKFCLVKVMLHCFPLDLWSVSN